MTGRWAILNGLLVLIVLLLGVQIVRTWGRTLPPVEITARPVEPAASKGGEKRDKGGKRGAPDKAGPATPTVMVTTIVNKDLFDPSRKQPTEETKPVQQQQTVTAPPQGVTLVGIRIFGKDSEAFITDASQQNKQRRVRTGDQVVGYTVTAIDRHGIAMSSPSGDPVDMPLVVEKSAKAGVPGVPGKPPMPGRPGQPPNMAQPPASPAAGVQNVPPTAAGIGARPPTPTPVPGRPQPHPPGTAGAPPGGVGGTPPVAGVPPGVPQPQPGVQPGQPQLPQLPAGVREKLEQMKER